MRIHLVSILVDDQEKALQFYTEVLGFVVKTNMDFGGGRWLTVVSPQDPDGSELVLELSSIELTQTYQKGLKAAGIPINSLGVTDIDHEYTRLKGQGVEFTMPPTQAGDVKLARFDDTCGNLMQLHEL